MLKIIGRYDLKTDPLTNKTGFPMGKISSVANGKIKHYKKFKFKYK